MTRIIADSEALATLCDRVAAAPRVALDTEFHNERSYSARLMVVQLALEDEIVIVDPLACHDLRPLAQALTKTKVVGHALSSDLRIFAERFNCVPTDVFDSQIAAAFCGFGMSISLLDLVQSVTGTRLRKSQTVSDWSMRPFSARQKEYLVDDVAYLFRLQEDLEAKLERSGRAEWAAEEMRSLSDPATYALDPERVYMRLPGAQRMSRRELGILRELAQLRDGLARERDVPPKFIFADDVAAGLVSLRPSSIEELAQLRRLEPGMRKAFGAEIIDAIARASALSEDELPPRPNRPVSVNRDALVSMMSVIVAAIATANDLPNSLLAPRAALERVARELPADAEAMAQSLELSSWRRELLVEPMLDLLFGRTSLVVTGTAEGNPRVVSARREE